MADKILLQKSFAALNEKLTKVFDESGVRRSFTVPYIEGQAADEHFDAVGQAATQSGGLGSNLLTSAHHTEGKGWGSGDGHTVGHPAEKLRNTIIPKDDEHAKAAIDAAQTHLNNVEKLLGDDDPTVMTAKNQLGLVKNTAGAGMNLLDFGTMLIQLMHAPNQAVARQNSNAHPDGMAPHLRAPSAPPQNDQAGGSEAPSEAPADGSAPEGQEASAAVPGAPSAPQGVPATPAGIGA